MLVQIHLKPNMLFCILLIFVYRFKKWNRVSFSNSGKAIGIMGFTTQPNISSMYSTLAQYFPAHVWGSAKHYEPYTYALHPHGLWRYMEISEQFFFQVIFLWYSMPNYFPAMKLQQKLFIFFSCMDTYCQSSSDRILCVLYSPSDDEGNISRAYHTKESRASKCLETGFFVVGRVSKWIRWPWGYKSLLDNFRGETDSFANHGGVAQINN